MLAWDTSVSALAWTKNKVLLRSSVWFGGTSASCGPTGPGLSLAMCGSCLFCPKLRLPWTFLSAELWKRILRFQGFYSVRPQARSSLLVFPKPTPIKSIEPELHFYINQTLEQIEQLFSAVSCLIVRLHWCTGVSTHSPYITHHYGYISFAFYWRFIVAKKGKPATVTRSQQVGQSSYSLSYCVYFIHCTVSTAESVYSLLHSWNCTLFAPIWQN